MFHAFLIYFPQPAVWVRLLLCHASIYLCWLKRYHGIAWLFLISWNYRNINCFLVFLWQLHPSKMTPLKCLGASFRTFQNIFQSFLQNLRLSAQTKGNTTNITISHNNMIKLWRGDMKISDHIIDNCGILLGLDCDHHFCDYHSDAHVD